MIAENVLDSAHLFGELAGRAVGERPEVVNEVGLVSVPKFVGQSGQTRFHVQNAEPQMSLRPFRFHPL